VSATHYLTVTEELYRKAADEAPTRNEAPDAPKTAPNL
jgi:hypothetical protein